MLAWELLFPELLLLTHVLCPHSCPLSPHSTGWWIQLLPAGFKGRLCIIHTCHRTGSLAIQVQVDTQLQQPNKFAGSPHIITPHTTVKFSASNFGCTEPGLASPVQGRISQTTLPANNISILLQLQTCCDCRLGMVALAIMQCLGFIQMSQLHNKV